MLVYSFDQLIGLNPVYCTCSFLISLVLHIYLTYIRLTIIHYYLHINIQTIQSLSHFLLLTWYQSHSSDFLVFVNIFGVLPLTSPSSNSHCQKWVTTITSTVPVTFGSHRSAHPTAKALHRVTEQPIPSKTQTRAIRNHLTCTSTRQLKFLPHKHALHTPPPFVTCYHELTRALRARTITVTRLTHSHVPHVLARIAFCHVSPRVSSTHVSIPIVDRWLWPKSKIFNRACLAQFFM